MKYSKSVNESTFRLANAPTKLNSPNWYWCQEFGITPGKGLLTYFQSPFILYETSGCEEEAASLRIITSDNEEAM